MNGRHLIREFTLTDIHHFLQLCSSVFIFSYFFFLLFFLSSSDDRPSPSLSLHPSGLFSHNSVPWHTLFTPPPLLPPLLLPNPSRSLDRREPSERSAVQSLGSVSQCPVTVSLSGDTRWGQGAMVSCQKRAQGAPLHLAVAPNDEQGEGSQCSSQVEFLVM